MFIPDFIDLIFTTWACVLASYLTHYWYWLQRYICSLISRLSFIYVGVIIAPNQSSTYFRLIHKVMEFVVCVSICFHIKFLEIVSQEPVVRGSQRFWVWLKYNVKWSVQSRITLRVPRSWEKTPSKITIPILGNCLATLTYKRGFWHRTFFSDSEY